MTKPKPKTERPRGRPSMTDWAALQSVMGTISDRDLAKAVGCNVSTVTRQRNARGIPCHAASRKVDWRKWDALIATMPDAKLAAQIGCHPTTVAHRRKKLDLEVYCKYLVPAAPVPAASKPGRQTLTGLEALDSSEMAVLQDALHAFRSDGFNHSHGAFRRRCRHVIGGPLQVPYHHTWKVAVSAPRRDRWIRLGLVEKIPLSMAATHAYRFSIAAMTHTPPASSPPSRLDFETTCAMLVKLHLQLLNRDRT